MSEQLKQTKTRSQHSRDSTHSEHRTRHGWVNEKDDNVEALEALTLQFRRLHLPPRMAFCGSVAQQRGRLPEPFPCRGLAHMIIQNDENQKDDGRPNCEEERAVKVVVHHAVKTEHLKQVQIEQCRQVKNLPQLWRPVNIKVQVQNEQNWRGWESKRGLEHNKSIATKRRF